MNRHQFILRSIVQSSFLLFCICMLCGCTIIGFGTGAIIDGSKQDNDTLFADAASGLSPRDEVRISLVDSTVIEGTYEQSTALDSSVYETRYTRFLQSARPYTTFPHIGDTLLVTTNMGKSQRTYSFRGFGIRSMNVQWLGQSQIRGIAFKQISAIENRSGVKLQPGILETMSNERQLPLDVSLVMETRHDTIRVPLDDIIFAEKANSKNAKWIGLSIGIAVDAILIVAVSNTLSHIGLR